MEAVAKEESLPPGFRFHPTDEELVAYYLSRKISDSSFTSNAVTDVDLNKCEPWDLPAKAKMGEKEWYFFSLRDRKYPTGLRTNRATDAGYWKTTGKDKEIFHSTTSELAGMKKTLVFYKGRAPKGEKTNWVMHEYRIQPKATIKSAKDEWVVCRVFKKTNGCKKFPTGGSVRTNPFHVDVGSAALSSLLHQDAFDHVNVGRSYGMGNADLMDLSRALRPGSTTHMNQLLAPPPFLQQMGLNLNLPTCLHPNMPLPMNGIQPQTVKIDSCCTSSIGMVTNIVLPASETRLVGRTELRQDCTVRGFQQIDPCQGLGGYWPAAPY